MKKIISLVVSIVIVFSMCIGVLPIVSYAVASTYYVATNGSDTNPGTSALPFLTIQHAVDSVTTPGDTIIVRAGTYVGFTKMGISGTAAAPITIKADTGARVILSTPSAINRRNCPIEVENAVIDNTISYWVIDGFEVANSPRHGIYLFKTDHCTIQNCTVYGSVATGLQTAFAYNTLMQNNETYSNGEHGVYLANSGDYNTVRNNLIHDNYGCGVHMNGDSRYTPGDGIVQYCTIENNTIYGNGVGGGSAINGDGVCDSTIRNNLVYNNKAGGISLFMTDGATGSSRNKIYNNTIVQDPTVSRWCISIPKSKKAASNPVGNIIKNNILYYNRTDKGSISVWGAGALASSNNNIVVDRFSINDQTSIINFATWKTYGFDTNSIISDPTALFVDPANNNYTLKAGSPAINAGANLGSDVPTDISGVARPLGTAYDIGCYECQ